MNSVYTQSVLRSNILPATRQLSNLIQSKILHCGILPQPVTKQAQVLSFSEDLNCIVGRKERISVTYDCHYKTLHNCKKQTRRRARRRHVDTFKLTNIVFCKIKAGLLAAFVDWNGDWRRWFGCVDCADWFELVEDETV